MGFNFKTAKRPIDVPEQWIYKNYIDFPQELDGSSVRVYSVFQDERTPSMYIYPKNGKYVWKDHSTGSHGDALDLVKALIEMASGETVTWNAVLNTIKTDYNTWKEKENLGKPYIPNELEIEHYFYELKTNYKTRPFTHWDLKYWDEMEIDETLLEYYYVQSLEYFQIGKKTHDVTRWGKQHGFTHSYGYFEKDGTLVKIYNPYSHELKHITLKKDILGREQIIGGRPLIIASSMKDLLCLKTLRLNLDVVAPMGEKILISPQDIDYLKQISTQVLTLFDNDRTGIKAMSMYKALYDIDFVYIPYYKDLAEFKIGCTQKFMANYVITAIDKKLKINETKDQKKGYKPIEIQGFTGF